MPPPEWLHDVFPERSLRDEPVVSAAEQPQVGRIVRPTGREWDDVINLKAVLRLASRSVCRDEGALPAISHKHLVPNIVGYMARFVHVR